VPAKRAGGGSRRRPCHGLSVSRSRRAWTGNPASNIKAWPPSDPARRSAPHADRHRRTNAPGTSSWASPDHRQPKVRRAPRPPLPARRRDRSDALWSVRGAAADRAIGRPRRRTGAAVRQRRGSLLGRGNMRQRVLRGPRRSWPASPLARLRPSANGTPLQEQHCRAYTNRLGESRAIVQNERPTGRTRRDCSAREGAVI